MKKKIFCVLVCMLVIGTTIPAIGAMTRPTTSCLKDHLSSGLYPTTPSKSPGTLITIRVWAKVMEVYDPSNFLEGKIMIDNIITGKYTYDAETPDSLPDDPTLGLYVMNNASCGVEITVGGLIFKTDPDDALTAVIVANDYEHPIYGSSDSIEVYSVLDFPLSQELFCYVDFIFWDSTAKAISSIALPTTAPVLRKWGDTIVDIEGYYGSESNYFSIIANITLVIKQYGANLQGIKNVIIQSPITTPTIVHIPFVRFWVKVVERFPTTFPLLRHLMGY